MKKSIQIILIASALIFVFTNQSFAGKKPFKGVITYKIAYSGLELDDATKAMLPKILTVMIKGNMSKTSINTVMGMQTTIYNGNDKTSVSLIDMKEIMGQKYAIQTSTEEINKEIEEQNQPTVKYPDETKEIAGYVCKKAEVTVIDDYGSETTFTVFYTNELGGKALNSGQALYSEIDGVMLEYEIDSGGMTMKFTAISVKKKNISDKEFTIPDEYKTITKDELKGMFGE